MTDIVSGLRRIAEEGYRFAGDAADEIERLRASLKAAEKERDALRAEVIHIKEVEFPRKAQAVADGWRGRCERLEAQIAEMEKQAPVRWGCTVLQADGSWKEEIGIEEPPKDYYSIRNAFPLYALPGAKGEKK